MKPAEPPIIGIETAAGIDIRIGRITRAETFAGARQPAIKLWVDFGPLGIKKSSAQITARYAPMDLPGRLVAAVVNFPPRQIAKFMSEVLVLGAVPKPGDVVLVTPDAAPELGARIEFVFAADVDAER